MGRSALVPFLLEDKIVEARTLVWAVLVWDGPPPLEQERMACHCHSACKGSGDHSAP